MNNKAKKIIAGACIGVASLGVFSGCSSSNTEYRLTVINDTVCGKIYPDLSNIDTQSVMVKHGDSYTFTIKPNSGYIIENLLIDGVKEAPRETYTFTNIKKSHSIGAIFAKEDGDYISQLKIVGIEFDAAFTSGHSATSNFKISNLKILHYKTTGYGYGENSSVQLCNFSDVRIDAGRPYSSGDVSWSNNRKSIARTKMQAFEVKGDDIELVMSCEFEGIDTDNGSDKIDYMTVIINRANLISTGNAYYDNTYKFSAPAEVISSNRKIKLKNIVLVMEATYSSEKTI